MRITLRDLFWLTLVVALIVKWKLEVGEMATTNQSLSAYADSQSVHIKDLYIKLGRIE